MHHSKPLSRRAVLGRFAAVGAAVTAGCGASSPTSPSTNQTSTGSTSGAGTTTGSCVVTPSETSGPYPDRLGMLGNTAFFRRDITEGRPGILLALTLTIANTASSCSAVAGANVEIWQCDASGHYSEYAQPGYDGTGQTYLRGLQTTDASGADGTTNELATVSGSPANGYTATLTIGVTV
jgi:protocatechuate 3,4-dioxygenase beta subunit